MNRFFAMIFVSLALTVTGACASLGKPDPLLPNAALTCAKLAPEAQDTCIQGVFAERDRTIAAVQAQSYYGYSSGYYPTSGFVRPYNDSGYDGSPVRTTTPYTGGGTVRGYTPPTTTPTPVPKKPGPPGTK